MPGSTVRRFILFALLAIALAGGGYYLWNQRREAQLAAAAVPLRSAQITRGRLAATVSAAGSIAPQARAELSFSAPGRVAEVPVAVGDVVRKGDLLARLEDADLLLALEQARVSLLQQQIAHDQLLAPLREVDRAVLQAAVALAEAQVNQAARVNDRTAVEIAQRNLELAQLALEQTYVLLDQAHKAGQDESALKAQEQANLDAIQVAQLQLEEAKRAPASGPLAAAEAGLASARAALQAAERGPGEQDRRIAELQVSQARTALEQARADLARTRLLAPFDGVVAAVNLQPGELAGPLPAVVLVDLSQLHMDVSVDEVDVARLQPGQPAQITADALPEIALAGAVERVAPAASAGSGVVSYSVRVTLDPAGAALRPGMSATAEIVIEQVADALLVPNWAIRRDRQSGMVLVNVQRGETTQEVEIEIGLRNEEYSQALSGVQEGDTVVVSAGQTRFTLFGNGG